MGNYSVLFRSVFILTIATLGPVVAPDQSRAKADTFARVTARQIDRLHTENIPELSGRIGEQLDLTEYRSSLRALSATVADTNAGGEKLLDRLVESFEAFAAVENRVREDQAEAFESFEELIDKADEGREDFSNERLLDEWFGTLGRQASGDRLLRTNREVLTLAAVYTGYSLRVDRRFRSELLMRYLTLLFPSVVNGYLQPEASSGQLERLYVEMVQLTDSTVRGLSESGGTRRNFVSLLQHQGRVLLAVARGGPRSALLQETLRTIDRIGRDATGVVDGGGTYPFLNPR